MTSTHAMLSADNPEEAETRSSVAGSLTLGALRSTWTLTERTSVRRIECHGLVGMKSLQATMQ